MLPDISKVRWNKTYRLINSCYPPCDIWEDVISKAKDWKLAYEIEAMTNPRIRQEIGEISLIPDNRIIKGVNSWWVIAAFTHINPIGTRFTEGTFGAYYAANNFETALSEKSYHTKKFMEATEEEIANITCRTLLGKINAELHDIRDFEKWKGCYNPDDYSKSQHLAGKLRDIESNGIVYKSVRNPVGECFAAFWPDVVSIPIQERHVVLHWNGEKISWYYDNGKRINLCGE
jgi:hypothetical protein